jgi:RNA 2',3'-cyclic 3'-phosphodiesterase
MSLTPPAVREHLLAELRRLQLMELLGGTLFPPLNWHQSLSDRFEDKPSLIEQLLGIGSKISARAVKLKIDRIESASGPEGTHWAFKPDKKPVDFDELLQSIQTAISSLAPRRKAKPAAHVTISYWAPQHLRKMMPIEPVEWLIDGLQIARGHGDPYCYEILGSWQLLPARVELHAEQLGLF